MSVKIDYSILNQKGTPAFFSDTLANRPAFGFAGRVFISTDSGQIFEDTGTAWNLIADAGVGGGTLSSVCLNGNTTATGIVITAGGLSSNSLTDTSLTTGSVLFADGGGLLTESNSTFFWDNTNKRLGIGNNAPGAPLDIHGTGTNAQFNGTGTNNAYLQFQNAGTSKWRIGNSYATGNNNFDIFNNQLGTTALSFLGSNSAATFINSVTATAHITTGGTSSQFVKGNGTLDSSVYITLANLSATTPLSYNNTTGAFTILQSGASQSGYLSSTDWNTFNNKAGLGSFSATTPLSYNSGTGAFTIQVANASQNGYLSSTDWNTFNNKQATLTFGNLTEAVSSVLTIAGGTGAVIGTGTTIQIKQSSASQSGYLSSTDWNTFNNKASALNGVGFVKANGTTISYDNSTYYLASNPNNYIALTGLSASSPLAYNNTSGGFSIQVATTSQNGYLSSTDWNTFNNKQNALTNPITGTGTTNYHAKFTGTSALGNSIISDDGGTATIYGNATAYGFIANGGSIGGFVGLQVINSLNGAAQLGLQNASILWLVSTESDNTFSINNGAGGTKAFSINTSKQATFSSLVTTNGNAQSYPGLSINNATGASGTYQKYIDFTAGGTLIARMLRGNGYSGYVGGGLNIDNYDGFQVQLNALGGSGGTFNILGGNVLIGTTTDNGNKLQVNGNFNASNVLSGTYAPNASSLSNYSNVSPLTAQYLRCGNVVTVSGSINVTPIATGGASFALSLPISTNFANTQQAGGTGISNITYEAALIYSVASSATVAFNLNTTYPSPHTIYYSFTYQIV
jgi:hypothetical protein